jgi:hypothetical protein
MPGKIHQQIYTYLALKCLERKKENRMKNKLVIGIVVIIAFIGFILIAKNVISKMKGRKAVTAAQAMKGAAKMPAKKVISKGKGALTVKVLNSKKTEIPVRLKAFKAIDRNSSIYMSSFVAGRSQELSPGDYDIETDSIPQKIYKGIRLNEGKETIEDLGCLTGSILIRTLNNKKTSAYYPIRILYPKSGEMVTAYMTNKSLEIAPGVYDIEIGTSPRQYKKNVKVDAGKEGIIDMGCITGILTVKTADEENKDVRQSVRIMKADTNEMVSSSLSNKPIELAGGKYNVEVLSTPRQSKKNINIAAGEESVVEFTVKPPVASQRQAASRAKPIKAQ